MSVQASEKKRTGARIWTALMLAGAVLVVAVIGFVVLRREHPAASEARRAFAAGRYEQASEALYRWLRAEPNATEAHYLKGRLALAQNKLPEAAEEWKWLQDSGHDRGEVRLLHALVTAKAGRHTEALGVLKKAYTESRKPDRQVDEALAKVYLETFDLTSAAAVLDRWATDFPDDPKPHLWRAEIHSRDESDTGVLERDYREVLKRDPKNARALLGLADELRKSHRNAEASTEYESYLRIEPNDAAAYLGAGRNAMETGDDVAATRYVQRAIELDPKNAEPHTVLANAAVRRGDWNAALASIDRAIALDPYDLTSRNLRGLALSRLDRTEEAKAEQATAATLRKDLGRLNEARTKLIASPHDRTSQLEIARWMFEHDHAEEGMRWAKKILAEHRDDPDAARLLADYHQRRGETGLANFYKMMLPSKPEPSPKRP